MQAINRFCPRSGKAVHEDSLTEYRGYVVGFCNPGCRDDFDANTDKCEKETQYFDVIIKEKHNN